MCVCVRACVCVCVHACVRVFVCVCVSVRVWLLLSNCNISLVVPTFNLGTVHIVSFHQNSVLDVSFFCYSNYF